MAQNSKIKEFPDIGSKLTAPTKKSLFERQKAEAEAKRQREQEETAAVYEDFVKSFDDAEEPAPSNTGSRFGGGTDFGGGFGGPSKRHFSGPPTGPGGRGGLGSGLGGGRGSGPGSLGPPPSTLSRKRAFDGSPPSQREGGHGLFAFEDSAAGPVDTKTAFQHSDEEEKISRARAHERAAPKPTIHLSSLPPGTSPAVIKALLPSNLKVDAVRILPTTGPVTAERKSLSALVTMAKDTPAIEIDTAVSALQNRYLGWGFYLSLSRHLSSAAIGSAMPAPTGLSSASSLPFGATSVPINPVGGLSRGAPTPYRGGYAPPTSYVPTGPGQFGRGAPPVQVLVAPPADLSQVRLIHKTLEALLTHGPEFEALLMSRPDVQKDKKWAWLWNPRSTGGVWYRWRLWDILTGAQQRMKSGKTRNSGLSQSIFEGAATWAAPERVLPFEYTTSIDEFVSDSDYDSSDDEDSGEEGRRRHQHLQGSAPTPEGMLGVIDADNQAYLNPLQKAKLTHLLARLPTTNAKLRRGDVARVTAFAIQRAGEGAEEVVELITSNIHTPFNFTSANPDRKPTDDRPSDNLSPPPDDAPKPEKEDTSPSKLIALYLISDILSSSSTSGVRHAWRYRQLFEAVFKRKHTFEHLGRLDKELSWGRLRAEKWKRSVLAVLGLWEGWCVFPAGAQEGFVESFTNPPLTAREERERAEAERNVREKEGKSKWRTVEERRADESTAGGREVEEEGDVDGEPMEEDVDGEPMEEDGDIDGEPMEEDGDIDDEPMPGDDEASRNPAAVDEKTGLPPRSQGEGSGLIKEPDGTVRAGRRRRPKAEDMFADSDGD